MADMIDINAIRAEFARHIHENAGVRKSLDGALMHVIELAYRAGHEDGKFYALQIIAGAEEELAK